MRIVRKATVYELLGMVKNGEELPEKVKYGNIIFENIDGDLLNDINCSLFEHRSNECEKLLSMLNDEVEIIEDNIEETELPEKWTSRTIKDMENVPSFRDLTPYIAVIMKTQNNIIDYLENKGE